MFWRFINEGNEKDKFGRTFEEAFKEHALWCFSIAWNNTPDSVETWHYIWNNSPICIECPPEFKKYYAGDAVINAVGEINIRFKEFKKYYTDEQIKWIEGWRNKNVK